MKQGLFRYRWLWLCLCLLTTPAFATTDTYPFDSPNNQARFNALIREIRCVVCQNQNIADSGAPLAEDLRGKVYLMIKNHQSDAEIKAYLVKRYGDFILLNPRVNKRTGLLWAFPWLGIVLVGLYLWRLQKPNR